MYGLELDLTDDEIFAIEPHEPYMADFTPVDATPPDDSDELDELDKELMF